MEKHDAVKQFELILTQCVEESEKIRKIVEGWARQAAPQSTRLLPPHKA